MEHNERETLYNRARVALRKGLLTEATNMFAELVDDSDQDARFLSYRGLLMAIRERRVCEGVAMCKRAIALASSEPEMHLNLARLYSTTGQRNNAVMTLRRAIRGGVKSRAVMKEIQRLSPRSAPPIPSLHRDHFLNDVLGKLRARLFRKRDGRSKPAAARQMPMVTPRVVKQRT